MPSSRGSSWPRIKPVFLVSTALAGTTSTTGEARRVSLNKQYVIRTNEKAWKYAFMWDLFTAWQHNFSSLPDTASAPCPPQSPFSPDGPSPGHCVLWPPTVCIWTSLRWRLRLLESWEWQVSTKVQLPCLVWGQTLSPLVGSSWNAILAFLSHPPHLASPPPYWFFLGSGPQ